MQILSCGNALFLFVVSCYDITALIEAIEYLYYCYFVQLSTVNKTYNTILQLSTNLHLVFACLNRPQEILLFLFGHRPGNTEKGVWMNSVAINIWATNSIK